MHATPEPRTPPMQPSNEASEEALDLARRDGEAEGRALRHMTEEEAHDGGEARAGDYIVAYAIEHAEGLYHPTDDGLEWVEPENENAHIEVGVRDAADGRFIPGLTVHATLMDADGNEIGTHRQPFLWHPWLFHYGRNWTVPGSGTYRLRVRIDPPRFARHDKVNGRRYVEPVEVEFPEVKIEAGQKRS